MQRVILIFCVYVYMCVYMYIAADISENEISSNFRFLFLKNIYLFLETGSEGEKGRETSTSGCLPCAPHWCPAG